MLIATLSIPLCCVENAELKHRWTQTGAGAACAPANATPGAGAAGGGVAESPALNASSIGGVDAAVATGATG